MFRRRFITRSFAAAVAAMVPDTLKAGSPKPKVRSAEPFNEFKDFVTWLYEKRNQSRDTLSVLDRLSLCTTLNDERVKGSYRYYWNCYRSLMTPGVIHVTHRQFGTSKFIAVFAQYLAERRGQSVAVVNPLYFHNKYSRKLLIHSPEIIESLNDRVRFKSGGEIYYFTPNPKTLRGMSFDQVLVDNVTHFERREWLHFYESTMPCVTARKNGRFFMYSTGKAFAGYGPRERHYPVDDNPTFTEARKVETKNWIGEGAYRREFDLRPT